MRIPVILTVWSMWLSVCFATELTFEYNDKSYKVASKVIDEFTYFSIRDFQSAIGFKIEENSLTKAIILKYQAKTVVFYVNNPWIVVDSEVINIPTPPQIRENTLWVPLSLVNEFLGSFLEFNVRIEAQKLIPYDVGAKIKKVVIDPGHGGKDPGAVGPGGLCEKEVVLEIAKLIAMELESDAGVKCILTRKEDVFVPLGRRAKIANREKADIFLSIHCNAHRKREKNGTEVFFLSPAKTTWARAVEARENASLKYETEEERSEIESILWDLAQTEFLKESNILSDKLVNSISTAIQSDNRGVKQANFYILRGVYMPSCLIEVEFISNPKWAKRLNTKEYQLKIAKSIVKGVKEFKEWYERQMAYQYE